jgi:glycosyltransferase involved in cell wall biosynthesis
VDILFLNNYHYLRGGSERVVFDELELLKLYGHKTAAFARKHTANITSEYEEYFPNDIKTDKIHFSPKAFRALREIFYSGESRRALNELLKQFHPDLAHAHNIYGRLTSSVLDLLAQYDIPIVMTLHDYKILCPSYKMLSDGQICEACRNRNFYLSIKKKCHKNSFLASTINALESYFCHWLGKYSNNVKFFITPSLFMKKKFIQYGWDEDRIIYLPNSVRLSSFKPRFNRGKYFLYMGRLSSEKGILTLIRAFMTLANTGARLLVVGQGPIRKHLEENSNKDPRIRFTGYLSGETLKETTQNALAVIVPSEWYENAPISILESFAYGKPVVASRIGGIPEMIDDGINGFLFETGNAVDLKRKLERILSISDNKICEMGQAARQKVERQFNAELHYKRLMDIYHKVIRKH